MIFPDCVELHDWIILMTTFKNISVPFYFKYGTRYNQWESYICERCPIFKKLTLRECERLACEKQRRSKNWLFARNDKFHLRDACSSRNWTSRRFTNKHVPHERKRNESCAKWSRDLRRDVKAILYLVKGFFTRGPHSIVR